MKIFTTILSVAVVLVCQAQTQSTLTATSTPKTGEVITYVYKPHAGLVLPEKMVASVLYFNSGYFNNIVLPLIKGASGYRFAFIAPDSVSSFLVCIADSSKSVIDNNADKAFTITLADKTGKKFVNADVSAAWLLSNYGAYVFKITPPKGYITGLYKAAFAADPSAKKDYYIPYLQALNGDDKNAARPLIMAYARKLMAGKLTESSLTDVINLYRLAGEKDSVQRVEKLLVTGYPKGEYAKSQFLNAISAQTEHSVQKYLASMQEYISTFGDSSAVVKDNFYIMIISYAADQKDWQTLNKYDALVNDKTRVAGLYNNIVWGLSGQHINNAGTDLDMAASLSQRALQTISSKIASASSPDEKQPWQSAFDTYADTYALILYKLGKFDSAYYYENAIDKSNFYDGGRELLASCIEKIKGPEAARQYIEGELLAGSSSTLLQEQLQNIYKQLNIPAEEFSRIKAKSDAVAKEKAIKEIVALLGSTQAKNFSLKDLEGNTVTLASLRNKVVVLDFWATWCGPCRASFPAMQEAVTKYKDDKDVVFLFLDVWEDGDEAAIRKNGAKFIRDNHYTFRVLVDHQSKVPPVYKVVAIPTKFIIDRKGNIVFMGHDISDMPAAIENAKQS